MSEQCKICEHEHEKIGLEYCVAALVSVNKKQADRIDELEFITSGQDVVIEIMTDRFKNMKSESEKYRAAFYAAKAFIDCHTADPDATPEMCEKYKLYHCAIRDCE